MKRVYPLGTNERATLDAKIIMTSPDFAFKSEGCDDALDGIY